MNYYKKSDMGNWWKAEYFEDRFTLSYSKNKKRYMNQEIKVVLMEKDDVDCLVFQFESESIDVNLNDVSGQQDMKKVFSEILRILCDNDIKLSFEVAEGYNRNLYKEVCSEYINDFNAEIKRVREEIERL